MTRGFLLVDQHMNTALLPYDDPSLAELFDGRNDRKKILDRAKVHDTKKELWADVRAYIDNKYEEANHEGNI